MDMYKVKWTRLQTEIFRFLCVKTGIKFNAREIAKELKVSPTAISNALPEVEKESLVRVERLKNMNLLLIEFNRENQKAIDLKRVENLRMIYQSGIVEFLEDSFPGCAIILFGSYSRGEDIFSSDIDIGIIGTKGKEIDLSKFCRILEREVIINFYVSWDIDKNLRNNILNGIVLNGGISL